MATLVLLEYKLRAQSDLQNLYPRIETFRFFGVNLYRCAVDSAMSWRVISDVLNVLLCAMYWQRIQWCTLNPHNVTLCWLSIQWCSPKTHYVLRIGRVRNDAPSTASILLWILRSIQWCSRWNINLVRIGWVFNDGASNDRSFIFMDLKITEKSL